MSIFNPRNLPKMSITKMGSLPALAVVGAMAFASTPSYALDKEAYQLSSHILDISTGKPAPNVDVQLMKQQSNGSWELLDTKATSSEGRVNEFLPNDGKTKHDGTYKLIFKTAPYFRKQGIDPFFPYVEVNFNIEGNKHYHVPITLSPYGYSTYRGS